MTDSRHNAIAAVGLGLAALLVIGLLTALMYSKSGEVAGALAGVLSGAIGAFGSAAAVYIMLNRQREEETEKVSRAVLMEVAELCKFPIGQLGACEMIQKGFSFPKADLPTLMETPNPIIYPAVADRISRLPRPTLVVSFYTRLHETRGVVAVIVHSPPINEPITPNHIQGLADLLISQCQLAKMVLSSAAPDPDREAALATLMRDQMLKVIDEQLATAKELFPNAESFQQA